MVIVVIIKNKNTDKLNSNKFKVSISSNNENIDTFFNKLIYGRELFITPKEDIEIKKNVANRGICKVYDKNYNFYEIDSLNPISNDNQPKLCDLNIGTELVVLNDFGDILCGEIKQAYENDVKTNDFYTYTEEGEERKMTEEEIQRYHKLMTKLYSPYKLPLKFGQTGNFIITGCQEILEISIY